MTRTDWTTQTLPMHSPRATRMARTRKHSEQISTEKLGKSSGRWARYDAAPPWTPADSLFAMCAPRPAHCETL
eukprot:9227767-Pyramimonas_sp.AAC.1